MSSKRKHDPEHAYTQPQNSRKRNRGNVQKKLAASQDDSDYHIDSGSRRGHHKSRPRPLQIRRSRKTTKIPADIANLADYNVPPVTRARKDTVSDIDDNEPPPTRTSRNRVMGSKASRSTSQSTSLSEKLRMQGARITKSTTTASRRKKSSFEEKVRAEADKLGRWLGWVSEEEDIDESDYEDQCDPRPLSRRYPPKTPGTQNTPWNELPGEVRNLIYQYAMTDEEKKVLNVRHYPEGVPRRSVRGISGPNNFAHSYWGLSQTCRQIREEFTPWLLQKRRVRTALESVNDYVNTFHRPGKDGERLGWVEPICCSAPLPQHGVDILELLKLQQTSPRFHLQLSPTTVSAALDALNTSADPDDFDELKIIHDIADTFADWSHDTAVGSIGLDGIHITSVPKDKNTITNTDEDGDEVQHEILIKFTMAPSKANEMPDEPRLNSLNAIIFAAQLSNKTGVKLEAQFDSGVAIWKVRRIGVVDMRWKAKARSAKFFHRLTQDDGYPGFTEEDLD